MLKNKRLINVIMEKKEIIKTWNAITKTLTVKKNYLMLYAHPHCIKYSFRSLMTNESKSACVRLKVTKYEPDIKSVTSNVQQKSH